MAFHETGNEFAGLRLLVFIGLFNPPTACSQGVQLNRNAFPLYRDLVAISSHADHLNCKF